MGITQMGVLTKRETNYDSSKPEPNPKRPCDHNLKVTTHQILVVWNTMKALCPRLFSSSMWNETPSLPVESFESLYELTLSVTRALFQRVFTYYGTTHKECFVFKELCRRVLSKNALVAFFNEWFERVIGHFEGIHSEKNELGLALRKTTTEDAIQLRKGLPLDFV